MSKRLTDAERFFTRHADYSYDPKTETPAQGRRRGGKSLAAAEAYAQAHGWGFEWEAEPYYSCADDITCDQPGEHEHEVLSCVLRDATGRVLASLGMIYDPSREYARVVQAELAAEALHHIRGEEAAVELERRHFAL